MLPDQQLPRDQADYVAAVERLLPRCQLSIHLVVPAMARYPTAQARNRLSFSRTSSRSRAARARAFPA